MIRTNNYTGLKKFLDKIANIFYIPTLAFLFLAYVSVYINPNQIWWVAVFGLLYPVSLFMNLIFLGYWIFRKKGKPILISLVLILMGWSHLANTFQFTYADKGTPKPNTSLKVMSYNVRLFDLYNWSHNKKTRDRIFDFIDEQQSDIICMQEFYKDDSNNFNTLDTLIKFQKAKYQHVTYTKDLYKIYHYGIATLSAYPIVNKGDIKFGKSNNICIYSDINFKGDTIRVYNNHLQSLHFKSENYNFIDSISYKNKEERIAGAKNILQKLKHGYILRANQADTIAEHIKQSPYPVLLCGDFNDTPVSYSYYRLSEALEDAYKISGQGMGATYAGNLPFIRIDFILHSEKIKSYDYHIHKVKYSDHYPVSCIVEIE